MWRTARRAFLAALILLAASPAGALAQSSGSQDPDADQAEIKRLMIKTWERPDAPLSVDPIVVVEDYAVAGWVQDDRGGRALLRKKHGTWEVVLCSGDQLRAPATITSVGAPEDLAQRLVERLRQAESALAVGQLAKFSSFNGIVTMDGGHTDHNPK